MSLIGSLEDLGLGDILQIISLSQKSGVLSIRGEDGEGSIVLRDGLVRGACLKGGPIDLRGVLVGGRFLEADAFDSACERARREGTTVEEALAAHTSLTAERIDSLRRECVEAAVMSMFAWRTGEFSFDVRGEVDADDPPLFLPMGINAQYLAMEGSRIEDESAHTRAGWRAGASDEMPDEPPDMSAEEMFGIDPGDALSSGPGFGDPAPQEYDPGEDTFSDDDRPQARAASQAHEALALAVAERAGPPEEEPVVGEPEAEEELGEAEGFALVEPLEPVDGSARAKAAGRAPVAASAGPTGAEAARPRLPNAPLVVIDPDLVALEWMKQTLKDVFPRVHIFQRWDLGLNPIRQYLARATRPVVLLAPNAAGDPLSGIRNGNDFIARLKAQQPRLPILWLRASDAAPVSDPGAADGALTRPSSQQLRSPRAAGQLQQVGARLREELGTVLSRGVESDAAPVRPSASPDPLRRLKQITAALGDASSRGEALPLAIEFAAEVFARVAVFLVRGDRVLGIAQSGLPKAGGPDDEALRRVELAGQGSAWFRAVLGSRRPVRAAPSDGGDYTVAAMLGSAAPREAYLAPIESGGEVVALLYADNLPDQRPLGDTEALEVVLNHVGLALERAMLERALAEAEGAFSRAE
jgi:hypothetical protein